MLVQSDFMYMIKNLVNNLCVKGLINKMDVKNKRIEKIKKMFMIIQHEKSRNVSLNCALDKVSKVLNLKRESAKNFYYKSLKFLDENKQIADMNDINLIDCKKNNFEKFEDKEKRYLVEFIDRNLEKGISIRQSCLILADNDAKKMLRYQNKYRNIKKLNSKKESKKMNVINISNAKDKLSKKISDSEINALFMGLVKIVKKAAIDNANIELKTECEVANQNFRQTIIDLNKKEAELKKMHEINIELNKKIESQQKQICLLLDKLSKRKINSLERKSEDKYSRLKNFDKSSKNNNIL